MAAAKIAARTSANARRSRFRRKSVEELESLRTKHLLILADIERVLAEKHTEAASAGNERR